ncbi:EAL and modified HD-GYP domain-containing putative signal transduction protein [Desulfocapsa sulfexigens DSM 10523]|uniref:EAL and modified HD-GYP domain-containing putative signal transduction protein n=1 Tax=Desulfocapsa sulfexigens (strain DSM 10523 / SB164P1) TaxID=1167006 RepID=M1P7B1_DESSD|nr:HDOD domain-containing protein [Desulfocapsa sulfexigens]AGF79363.1 EAL and modified HD-GYP domain-containing putative signal transduction protein [Desulfocapsa sulfexigens DSM 10523]
MDVFVARQPIFDSRKKLFAYELLFRTGMANAFPDLDGETATSSLLSSSFFTVGIEQISGGHRSFINFTEDLLLKGTPAMLPAENVVVEVLENVNPTEEVREACRELVAKGYDLALDDFVFTEEWLPLVKIAKVIKIDFRLTPIAEIESIIETVKPYKCKLLAEKIETYDEFQQALEMGFVYFQGYFFAKPEVLRNKDIPSSQLTLLQLITEVNRTEFDVNTLEKLINQDVSVSFKLLKYLNSAFFYRVHPISSIRQAIAFLGERGVRQFVSLIATSKLSESKPSELLRTSIIRARMLELIAESQGKSNSCDFFMLGLFSLIDAMLDNSMTYLMEQLPLTDSVKDALAKRRGNKLPYLQAVESYETGNWEKFEETLDLVGADRDRFPAFYLDAVGWADSYQ